MWIFSLMRQNQIYLETQQFQMLVVFSPIFVEDTKINFDYNFVAPLKDVDTSKNV